MTRTTQLPFASALRHRIPAGRSLQGEKRHWVFGLCLAGECEHGRPDDRFPFRGGDALIIRPGTPLRWRTLSTWDVVSCTFWPRPHWRPWLDWDEAVPGFGVLRLSGSVWIEVRRCLLEAVEASGSGREDAPDFALSALEAALLHCRRARRPEQRGVDPRLRPALDALESDLGAAHGLDALAARCGISRAQLARLFREQVGVSPMSHLSRLRLRHASRLLQRSDLPIKRIALEVGFPNQRYFSSWFRRRSGRTPREHRRSQ
jgi:AraC-like DNA-binding protein